MKGNLNLKYKYLKKIDKFNPSDKIKDDKAILKILTPLLTRNSIYKYFERRVTMFGEKEWFLYVLRYKRSGCYYVGITPDLDGRMDKHHNSVVTASELNMANEGFYYYWYFIRFEERANDKEEALKHAKNDHSLAALTENTLTKYLRNEIDKKYVVNGGCFASPNEAEVNIIEAHREKRKKGLPASNKRLFEAKVPEDFKTEFINHETEDLIEVTLELQNVNGETQRYGEK